MKPAAIACVFAAPANGRSCLVWCLITWTEHGRYCTDSQALGSPQHVDGRCARLDRAFQSEDSITLNGL